MKPSSKKAGQVRREHLTDQEWQKFGRLCEVIRAAKARQQQG
jgi:hypothetical protein